MAYICVYIESWDSIDTAKDSHIWPGELKIVGCKDDGCYRTILSGEAHLEKRCIYVLTSGTNLPTAKLLLS